jgi:outer membrane protein
MRTAGVVVVTIVVALLSGCISPISFIYPRNVPVSSLDCPGPPVPGPPVMRRPQEITTLEQCIAIARANNPGLAAGAWDVQTALAQRDNVASQQWPDVGGVGSYRSYVQNQRLVQVRKNNDPGMFSSSILAGDVVLRLPLFTGGRIRSEIAAGDLLSQAATHRFARTWEELIFNISSAFYTVLGQQPVIQSLRFSFKALNKQRQRALDMMRVGKAAKVDVLRTEVRISEVEQRLVREETVLEIQRRFLTTLMGIGDGKAPLSPQGDLRATGPIPELNGALAMAYAERGDYKAAKASVSAQAMRVSVACAQRWPRLFLEGTYGTRYAAGITDNGATFINRFIAGNPQKEPPSPGPGANKNFNSPGVSNSLPVGNIGIVADYPIFDGGRITAQIREQEARLASAQQNLRKLELQIRLDVETALLNVDSASKRVQATRKAIEQAKESFRIETEKYDLGKGSISDVLDSQAAMLDAETGHYRALSDRSIALAQLGLATGEKR